MRVLFFKNLRLKLISIAFAFALWFFVAGQSPLELGIMVPLGYKGVAKDMLMTSAPFGDIDVRVTGPRFLLNNIEPGKVIAELDLSNAKEGTSAVKILPADVNVPMGIKVSRVVPSSVQVHLERLVEVELPVKVRFHGVAAAGYRVSSISVNPKTVRMKVFAKDASAFKAIYTKPIDISGLDESANMVVGFDALEYESMSLNAQNVAVKVNISKAR